MSKKRRCSCRWVDCEQYRELILEKAPNDHPWTASMVRLTFPSCENSNISNKSISWLMAIRRYLFDNESNYHIPLVINIYPHHFPLALWRWREDNPKVRWNTLISKTEARKIAKYDFDNNRYMEYTNSMYFY